MDNYFKKYFEKFFNNKDVVISKKGISIAGELDNTTLSKLENSEAIYNSVNLQYNLYLLLTLFIIIFIIIFYFNNKLSILVIIGFILFLLLCFSLLKFDILHFILGYSI